MSDISEQLRDCVNRDDLPDWKLVLAAADRTEKLEAALEDMAQYISRADWTQLKKETLEVWDLGGLND